MKKGKKGYTRKWQKVKLEREDPTYRWLSIPKELNEYTGIEQILRTNIEKTFVNFKSIWCSVFGFGGGSTAIHS